MPQFKYVKGFMEIHQKLLELPAQVEAKIVRAALRAGATVIRKRAQEIVPVKSGSLKRSLKVSTFKKGRQIHARVKTDMYYSHMVEGGTARHIIKAKQRPTRVTRRGVREYSISTMNKMLSRGTLVIGGKAVGETVIHPGARPRRFMALSLQTGADRALEAIAARAREGLAKLYK